MDTVLALFQKFALIIHILFSLVAMILIGFAAIQAACAWFIHYLLHAKKNPHTLLKLPPLESMEKMLIKTLLTSFILMSLSLCSGFLFLRPEMRDTAFSTILFSVCSWGFIGTLLLGHYRLGWRGLMITKMTFLITLLLSIGYYSSHLLTITG